MARSAQSRFATTFPAGRRTGAPRPCSTAAPSPAITSSQEGRCFPAYSGALWESGGSKGRSLALNGRPNGPVFGRPGRPALESRNPKDLRHQRRGLLVSLSVSTWRKQLRPVCAFAAALLLIALASRPCLAQVTQSADSISTRIQRL